jgi:proteasome lid subunit RPN8/RPN11
MLFGKKAKQPEAAGGQQKNRRKVALTRQAADGIITFAKTWHPNEAILILQGGRKGDTITIDGLVVPPFTSNGPFFSGFSLYDLPFDSSYVGTAHSHPGASNKPSLEDLNHFFGLVSVIISFPYEYETIGAFDRNGTAMPVSVID